MLRQYSTCITYSKYLICWECGIVTKQGDNKKKDPSSSQDNEAEHGACAERCKTVPYLLCNDDTQTTRPIIESPWGTACVKKEEKNPQRFPTAGTPHTNSDALLVQKETRRLLNKPFLADCPADLFQKCTPAFLTIGQAGFEGRYVHREYYLLQKPRHKKSNPSVPPQTSKRKQARRQQPTPNLVGKKISQKWLPRKKIITYFPSCQTHRVMVSRFKDEDWQGVKSNLQDIFSVEKLNSSGNTNRASETKQPSLPKTKNELAR